MVFYFSGTGNSRWVAQRLSEALLEPLVSIADVMKEGEERWIFSVRPDERILFVYPVHAWGPAVPVIRFIDRLVLTGYHRQPIYSVSSCGDECGYTDRIIRKALERKGFSLQEAYSVMMPNNYILLPGFDVDFPEVAAQKLQEAPARVEAIGKAIGSARSVSLYHTGSWPALKSRCVYPLFAHVAIGRNSFYATEACISCGLCARICPTGAIRLDQGKPVWSDLCVQCVACIHRCPVRAIEYGKETLKKGRYHHPSI